MADWIKMRSSLPDQPRVTKMARTLLGNPEFAAAFLPFLSDEQKRDAAVTKAIFPVVTKAVVGALVSIWAMVNDTAGSDGIVRHASSQDMDGIAGIPGFGEALKTVEWLEDLPDGSGVRFINFEEHNSPQKERSPTSKSGAERTRAYRERKKAGRGGDEKGDEGRDSDDASRGDNREKREKEKKKNTNGAVDVPDWIPEKQWGEFVAMRRAKGSRAPFTVGAARGIVQKLDELRAAGHDPAAVLAASVINGWSDVYELKGGPAQPPAQGSFV